MPMMESTATIVITFPFLADSGSRGSENRRKPVRPHLQQNAGQDHGARRRRLGMGVGSQVWNGNIGTFTAKPTKNAQKTHH